MIPPQFTEDDLRHTFEQFGKLTDCTILRDGSGESKRCGFVKFQTRSEAVSAISALHRTYISVGCSNPLVVKFADTIKPKKKITPYLGVNPMIPSMIPPMFPPVFAPVLNTPIMGLFSVRL
jgi:CUG-BP- and ETR3-like factor